MLRLFRFVATLGFDPDPEALAAVMAMRERLGIVSRERIRDELIRLMMGEHVAPALEGLVSSGLVEEFLPELAALATQHDPLHRHKDVLAHTIAVVGKHQGTFREGDLDLGQSFKNNYDETKFLSEKLVRERRDSIPTIILRPTTVVGHSRTGAIEKIDGPYYALNMIARKMHRAVPNTGDIKFHFGPVDFVADAFYHLFEDEESVGKAFHLVDPAPLTYLEFFDLACATMGESKPSLKLPAPLMRPMGRLPMFEKLTGVPREAFEHSFYPIEYDMSNVAPALAKHGISCPPVPSYIGVMIEYFVKHSDDPRIRRGDWRQVTT
jgi:hypothetical protein